MMSYDELLHAVLLRIYTIPLHGRQSTTRFASPRHRSLRSFVSAFVHLKCFVICIANVKPDRVLVDQGEVRLHLLFCFALPGVQDYCEAPLHEFLIRRGLTQRKMLIQELQRHDSANEIRP